MRNRVLIVEDEPLLAFDLEKTIRNGGFEVVGPTDSIVEAIELIQTQQVDVAVVDYWLRKENADTLIAELEGRGIQFIIITGDQAALGRFIGIPVLVKPSRRDEIIKHLWGCLADPRSNRRMPEMAEISVNT